MILFRVFYFGLGEILKAEFDLFFDLQLIISISYEKSVSSVNFNTFVGPQLRCMLGYYLQWFKSPSDDYFLYNGRSLSREEIKDETHALEDDEQDEADDNDEEESSDVDMD